MTVLIDTSAWVEFFRATGSAANVAVRTINASDERFHTCAPVSMELKAGAVSENMLLHISSALANGSAVATDPHHFDMAATVYRACRARGFTIRSMVDCLIAAVAIAQNLEVLHHDRDFNSIAQVVPLRIHRASLPA